MFWSEFLKKKHGTPLSRIWLISHWDKKVTKLQISQMNLGNICEEMIDPTFRSFSLRTMAFLLLGVSRVNLRKASYLYQECNEFYFKLTRDNKATDLDMPPPRPLAVTYQEEDILNQRLSLNDFWTFDDVHHVHQFYPREERFSMIEENIHLIEEEINEFGDERSQITFEDLNLINEPKNNSIIEKMNNRERNSNESLIAPALNEESAQISNLEQSSNNIIETEADVTRLDISAQPKDNIITEPSPEEQNISTSHTTLIPNDQDNNQFILPAVEIDQQGRRKKKRKLIMDKEIIIRSDVFRKQLTLEDTICLEIAPPTKKLMNLKITGNVESGLMIKPGLNFLSDKLIKYYKRNLVTKNISNSPKPPLEFEEIRKRKRVNGKNDDRQITKRPTFDKNNLTSGESICEQIGNPSSDILQRESETMQRTLENSIYIREQNTLHSMQQSYEPMDIQLLDLNTTNIPQPTHSILAGPSTTHTSAKRVSFSKLEPILMEYTPEETQSSQKNNINNLPDTESINKTIDPNIMEYTSEELISSQTNDITNLPDSETISKNKKSQKINLLKILVPKLNRTDKLTFRNLVDQKTRLEVALTFNTLLTLKKEAVIDLNQEMSFSEIQISPGKNYTKYSYLK